MAVLVVLIIILVVKTAVFKSRLEECRDKNGFLTPGIGNFEIAGMNPLWWYGSGDAGSGGSLARDTTPQQISVYEPRYRRSVQKRMARQRRRAAELAAALAASGQDRPSASNKMLTGGIKKENMHSPPCATDELQSTDGRGDPMCLEPGEAWGASGCGAGWDPAAVAESQGLYAAGGLGRDPLAEDRLRDAANAMYNTQLGLTESQIPQLAKYDRVWY